MYATPIQLKGGRSLNDNLRATKGIIRDFNFAVNAHKRNELPNKYNTRITRSQDLESVISTLITEKFDTEPRTDAMVLLHNHLNGSPRKNSEPRPFYYANRNEMMSLDDFFKAYKLSEYQREIFEKQQLRERIETNRKKLDEMKQEASKSPNRPPTRSLFESPQKSLNGTPEIFPSTAKKERPLTSNPNSNPNKSPDEFFSTAINDEPERNSVPQSNLLRANRPQTANLRSASMQAIHQDTQEEELNRPSITLSPPKDGLRKDLPSATSIRFGPATQHLYPTDSVLSLLLDKKPRPKSGMARSASAVSCSPSKKVLNKEPKFTTKEIYRHLAYLTVTPRKLKKDPNVKQIEQYYVGIFRDAKSLEKSVDLQGRKSTGSHIISTLPNLLTESRIPHHMQGTRSSKHIPRMGSEVSIANSKVALETENNDGIQPAFFITSKQEDVNHTKTVRSSINENIKHIDMLLKKGKIMERQASAMSRSRSSNLERPTIRITETARRVPLRKEIEKKYKMSGMLKINRDLDQRMKIMKHTLDEKTQNSTNQVTYENFKYISYFH